MVSMGCLCFVLKASDAGGGCLQWIQREASWKKLTYLFFSNTHLHSKPSAHSDHSSITVNVNTAITWISFIFRNEARRTFAPTFALSQSTWQNVNTVTVGNTIKARYSRIMCDTSVCGSIRRWNLNYRIKRFNPLHWSLIRLLLSRQMQHIDYAFCVSSSLPLWH